MNTILIFLLKLWKIILLLFAIGFSIFLYNLIKNLNLKLGQSTVNNKALFSDNKALKNKNYLYEITIDLFHYFNDSINLKLDSVIKQNKIKDNKIKQLLYIKTQTSKVDTISFPDTILINNLKLDTTINKPGYSLVLLLEYPNKIVTTPTFINEQYIIFSNKKETIEPPKKFFLLRWFLKKHTVVTIDVINSNPYVDIQSKRFIEIIK